MEVEFCESCEEGRSEGVRVFGLSWSVAASCTNRALSLEVIPQAFSSCCQRKNKDNTKVDSVPTSCVHSAAHTAEQIPDPAIPPAFSNTELALVVQACYKKLHIAFRSAVA